MKPFFCKFDKHEGEGLTLDCISDCKAPIHDRNVSKCSIESLVPPYGFTTVANACELVVVLSSEAASSVAASRSCLTWNTHPPHHRHVTGSGCPGIEKFKKAAQDVQGKILSGQDAFILWDTYGFPLDLTQLMVEERGLLVDTQGFNNAMDEARERSRSAQNKQAGGTIAMDADATAALRKQSKSLLVAVLVIVLSIYSFSFFLSFFPKDDQCNN
ncbi:alanine--tRNA ligase [Cucumis melo var. makuwa]|uniref:Alanine--tRNA ligase n=1 Tax=Cucumis melo var. makuwa TaxID=1194695 RepID=A0A5D3DHV4_CUCMM|nr:alanine--tRNA ligase [Cucumis melo var. makuwa]